MLGHIRDWCFDRMWLLATIVVSLFAALLYRSDAPALCFLLMVFWSTNLADSLDGNP